MFALNSYSDTIRMPSRMAGQYGPFWLGFKDLKLHSSIFLCVNLQYFKSLFSLLSISNK